MFCLHCNIDALILINSLFSILFAVFFFFSSRRRHTRLQGDWSSDVCSSDLIWAGMGGSIMAVRVLTDLGFCSGRDKGQVTIYPLDSTDPAALNEIVRKIAEARNLALPAGKASSNPAFLQTLLGDVMMVGVSMGMTSEEPTTHLTWFTDFLKQAGLSPAENLLAITLSGHHLVNLSPEQQAATP